MRNRNQIDKPFKFKGLSVNMAIDVDLKSSINVRFMSFDRAYLLLLSFLTAVEFYHLGHIQGIIRVP